MLVLCVLPVRLGGPAGEKSGRACGFGGRRGCAVSWPPAAPIHASSLPAGRSIQTTPSVAGVWGDRGRLARGSSPCEGIKGRQRQAAPCPPIQNHVRGSRHGAGMTARDPWARPKSHRGKGPSPGAFLGLWFRGPSARASNRINWGLGGSIDRLIDRSRSNEKERMQTNENPCHEGKLSKWLGGGQASAREPRSSSTTRRRKSSSNNGRPCRPKNQRRLCRRRCMGLRRVPSQPKETAPWKGPVEKLFGRGAAASSFGLVCVSWWVGFLGQQQSRCRP